MQDHKPDDAAMLDELVSYVSRNAPEVRDALRAQHGSHTSESVRQAIYKGHQITIRTSYHIEVDGRPIEGHMGVTNDGRVHYHAIPNLSYASAVDLVKQLIDTFPDDFRSTGTDSSGQHHHGEEA